jgi:hypothetical protein
VLPSFSDIGDSTAKYTPSSDFLISQPGNCVDGFGMGDELLPLLWRADQLLLSISEVYKLYKMQSEQLRRTAAVCISDSMG